MSNEPERMSLDTWRDQSDQWGVLKPTVPREVADRLAEACETDHLLSLLQYIGSGNCTCDYDVGAAPCEACVANNAATRLTAALAEYRKAVKP